MNPDDHVCGTAWYLSGVQGSQEGRVPDSSLPSPGSEPNTGTRYHTWVRRLVYLPCCMRVLCKYCNSYWFACQGEHEITKSNVPIKSCIPLTLLEVYHWGRNKEPMAASSRTNTSDIQVCPTGVCLFNGSVSVTCTWLLECQLGQCKDSWHMYLWDFTTTLKMCFV